MFSIPFTPNTIHNKLFVFMCLRWALHAAAHIWRPEYSFQGQSFPSTLGVPRIKLKPLETGTFTHRWAISPAYRKFSFDEK